MASRSSTCRINEEIRRPEPPSSGPPRPGSEDPPPPPPSSDEPPRGSGPAAPAADTTTTTTASAATPEADDTPTPSPSPSPAASLLAGLFADDTASSSQPVPIFIDLETRSACDLKTAGGRRYAQHPTTALLSAVALIDRRLIAWVPGLTTPLSATDLWPDDCRAAQLPISVYTDTTLPEPLQTALDAGRPFCAHNAHDFDRHVWSALGLPEPTAWLDTLPCARAAGLPGRLDQLGQRLFGVGKDAHGKQLINRYCRPNTHGEFVPLSADAAHELLRYNIVDVLLLARLFPEVQAHGEPDVMSLDRVINQRGIAFDADLAQAIVSFQDRLRTDTIAGIVQLTDGALQPADFDSPKKLHAWLRQRDVRLPDLQRATIEQRLRDHSLSPTPRAVLQARLAVSHNTGHKLENGLKHLDADGRLRDLLVYHKAHTGRWTARYVQPHNLPRPHPDLKDLEPLQAAVHDLERFRALLPPTVSIEDALAALVRPCFRAALGKLLCLADFASIEARGVAWCAGERQQLELFAQGGDNYCAFASRIFGRPINKAHKRERHVGKEAVLGCGYAMGPGRFAETCAARGVDLTAAQTTAAAVVEAYRSAYPAIAGTPKTGWNGRTWRAGGLWHDVQEAAQAAVRHGTVSQAGRCLFLREGTTLVIQLPSGRKLCYPNARIEAVVPGYCQKLGLPEVTRPTLVFDGTEGREETYGGKLVENFVQAICRDLLAAALLECERQGLPVVLHVHDEIIVEAPEAEAAAMLESLARIMSTPPSWAEGFPIEVEGFACERYGKSPPDGGKVVKARNGALLEG